jgi:hypothetical protein
MNKLTRLDCRAKLIKNTELMLPDTEDMRVNTGYRSQEIKRRADRIRDALAGRDRLNTNAPAQPFILLGQPIDGTNIDELLVAAVAWGEEQERRYPFSATP